MTSSLFTAISLALLSSTVKSADTLSFDKSISQSTDTCTALVLSGGGSNGAWESGVLWGLLNYGDKADYQYDVVTGVSIGSINASVFSVFPVG